MKRKNNFQGDKMKDYYKIIVELCGKLCYKDDYGCKEKVRAHNRAMTKLFKLDKELNTPEGSEILMKLLYHENDHVILSAAMLCLKLKIHPKETLERMIYVRDNSKDSIISFEAEMMIKERHNIK